MNIPLDEVFHFDAITRSSGGLADADSPPTWAIYEEADDTPIRTGTMTKRTSLTGRYRGSVTCSDDNGFDVGKWYSLQVATTVSGVDDVIEVAKFRCVSAENSTGAVTSSLATDGLDQIDVDSTGTQPVSPGRVLELLLLTAVGKIVGDDETMQSTVYGLDGETTLAVAKWPTGPDRDQGTLN